MPRGVPKAGFRMTKNRMNRASSQAGMRSTRNTVQMAPVAVAPVKKETDAQIREKLAERFDAMDAMAASTMRGINKSMIVSGPAGLGKSFGVMKLAEQFESKGKTVSVIKGYLRPTGLYKTLYENRHRDCVIVFDDADSVFMDDVSLNLLKAACDMTRTRKLHWLTETKMEDEDGERMPRSFEFEGSVIFITNYDFDDMIARGNRLAPHFQALISRSIYLDLAMKTNRDYIVRIHQVVEMGMLDEQGISKSVQKEILEFVETNADRLRELSLRMVMKLAALVRMDSRNWQKMARVTCLRNI
jgi:hypothetical protein